MFKKYHDVIKLCLIFIAIFYLLGFNKTMKFIKMLFFVMWQFIIEINMISIPITGQSILSLLFGGVAAYFIVGIIFGVFCLRRGTFRKCFGKISYHIVFYFVGIILDFLTNIFF